jgi:hypothetical protein
VCSSSCRAAFALASAAAVALAFAAAAARAFIANRACQKMYKSAQINMASARKMETLMTAKFVGGD